MATEPRYTKKTLTSLKQIFTDRKDEILSAYYGGDSKTARKKINNIIDQINKMIDSFSTIDKVQETATLNAMLKDFVNSSPIINGSAKSTKTQGKNLVKSAKNSISYSKLLSKEVMRFGSSYTGTDQAKIILAPYQNKIYAYNTLITHTINGTLDKASEEDIVTMRKGFFPDNPRMKSKDVISSLKEKSLDTIVNEYNNYLDNTVLKDPNVLTIAKMQNLDRLAHGSNHSLKNTLLLTLMPVLTILGMLPGFPLQNADFQTIMQHILEVILPSIVITEAVAGGISAATTLPGSLKVNKTNKKMLELNLKQMNKVFELIKENQPTQEKDKYQCIEEINKKLREEKIPLQIDENDYKVLSVVENNIQDNPLSVSRSTKRQESKNRRAAEKALMKDPVKYRGLAAEILSPVYQEISELGEGKALDNLMSILNPNGILSEDGATKVVTTVSTPKSSSPTNTRKTKTRTAPKPKKVRGKVEVEDMEGYDDVVDALKDKSENNVQYNLQTKKRLAKKSMLECKIKIMKTKYDLSDEEALSIMDLIEQKINKENFNGGPITHEPTGTVIEVSDLKRGKPETPKKPKTTIINIGKK